MKLDYKVHSVAPHERLLTVKHEGKDREVRADALRVELVGNGNAFALDYDDVAEAEKLFKVGKPVTLTFGGSK